MRRGQPRRWAIYPYTDRELAVIELRTHGLKPTEIARRLGISRGTVHHRLSSIYKKAGFSDVALLTRWAIQNGLDEALPPERPDDLPEPKKRRTKTRIRMRRIH